MLDVPSFDPDQRAPPDVTLHQLFSYFNSSQLPDIDQHLLDIAGESEYDSRRNQIIPWIVMRTACQISASKKIREVIFIIAGEYRSVLAGSTPIRFFCLCVLR